jgi:hypothetical protein
MGNLIYSSQNNDDIIDQISKYHVGDINEFLRLAEICKSSKDPRIHAWKIACLYYYMVTLPDYEHDLGSCQPNIIVQYNELKCSSDKDIKDFIAIGSGEIY